jgi:hypothetical protein
MLFCARRRKHKDTVNPIVRRYCGYWRDLTTFNDVADTGPVGDNTKSVEVTKSKLFRSFFYHVIHLLDADYGHAEPAKITAEMECLWNNFFVLETQEKMNTSSRTRKDSDKQSICEKPRYNPFVF